MDANGLRDVVRVRHGDAADLPEAGTFDVVVANIIARVVQASAPSLARQLRPGGRLVASGILVDHRDDVASALDAAGLRIEQTDVDGDWCAIWATRR